MTNKANGIASDTPPRWIALSWMLFAGGCAISFAAYGISLLFLTPEILPLLAISALTVIGLAPFFSNLFFCPWMNIGFGAVVSTPILGALTYAYTNWFMICTTVFIASLASMMWALSGFGTAAALWARDD